MKQRTRSAPAKLNLNLHIWSEKLPNGFYPVLFLNCPASLADQVRVELVDASGQVKLSCDNPDLPVDERNLAFQAAKLMMDEFRPKQGVLISIKKQIPVTGGLGGGSTDAAAVILALDSLLNLQLSDQKKLSLAAQLGMDVCYSVMGGLCRIEGGGEKVSRLKMAMPNIPLLIVSPSFTKSSTAWAYQQLDQSKLGESFEKYDRLLAAIKKKDLAEIGRSLHNDFETMIFRKYNQVKQIKERMLQLGALGAVLAGSGLSVFGLYPDKTSLAKAAKLFQKDYDQVYETETL